MTEHKAFEIHNADGKSPILLLCDHATNMVPRSVNDGTLGLPDADMNRHIAYDLGAREVVRHLSDILDATALMSRFSRLVIDPNRAEDDPTILMKLYDGSIIPGNRYADAVEKQRRIELFHRPYHQAITDQIDSKIAQGQVPVLVSIHSFTPQLRGRSRRPWHLGVLWDSDGRIPGPFMEYFAQDPDVVVGDNEPYSGQLQGDTMYQHGTSRNLPHVLIEIRHDLIETEETQFQWADRIAPALWTAMEGLDAGE